MKLYFPRLKHIYLPNMPPGTNQPGEISNLQLKISYWYVRNFLLLKKYLAGFLIGVSVIAFGYCLWQLTMIFFIDWKNYQQNIHDLPRDLISYSYFHETQKPQPLQVLTFDATGGTEGKYDLIARVKNPNPNFAATSAVFQLLSGGKVMAEKMAFFLPHEEKFVAFFGQERANVSDPIIQIAAVHWSRQRGYDAFAAPRLRFETSEVQFKNAAESGIKGELPVSLLTFKIKNNSAFSFWSVGVHMVLISGETIAGGNFITLDQFMAQETRTVEMRWYESLPLVSKVEIVPEVNILSPDVYMPVK